MEMQRPHDLASDRVASGRALSISIHLPYTQRPSRTRDAPSTQIHPYAHRRFLTSGRMRRCADDRSLADTARAHRLSCRRQPRLEAARADAGNKRRYCRRNDGVCDQGARRRGAVVRHRFDKQIGDIPQAKEPLRHSSDGGIGVVERVAFQPRSNSTTDPHGSAAKRRAVAAQAWARGARDRRAPTTRSSDSRDGGGRARRCGKAKVRGDVRRKLLRDRG